MANPGDPPTLALHDLQPADVLLTRGSGELSRLILMADGGRSSHAMLYLGRGRVGEAVGAGVVENPIGAAMLGVERCEVFRHRAAVGQPAAGLGGVLARAHELLAHGERYAYEAIVLLAMVCATRRLPGRRGTRQLLRRVFDEAAGAIAQLAANGREPMICSEFVYRCFTEAEPPLPLSVRLFSAGALADESSAPPLAGETPLELAVALREAEKAARHAAALRARQRFIAAMSQRGVARQSAPEAGRRSRRSRRTIEAVADGLRLAPAYAPNPHMVTPRDLQESPDLALIGILHSGNAKASAGA